MRNDYSKRGKELIGSLKHHITTVLRDYPNGRKGITVKELQECSGLTIKAENGSEVWLMGVITLLVELWKEGIIDTDSNSSRTDHWKSSHRVWLKQKSQ